MDFSDDKGWDKLVDAVDLKFGIINHGRKTEPLEDRPELTQAVQFITFERDGKTYKMERVTGPAVIDRKSHYHKAAGSTVRFENVYDENETSRKTNFYVKAGDDWQPVSLEELALH